MAVEAAETVAGVMQHGDPSQRLRAALAAAKERGTVLGNPDNLTPEAAALGPQRNREAARQAYRTTLGYVRLLRENGVSYDKIAKRLNEEGHTTRTGAPFAAMTVYRMVA